MPKKKLKNLVIAVPSRKAFDEVDAILAGNPKTKKMWESSKKTVEKAFYKINSGEGEFLTEACDAIIIDVEGKEQFIHSGKLQSVVRIKHLNARLDNL